ncbi:male-specific lethal 3 homolog isoform X2 [Cylas formicarius]|uniref:male-specific lethal 3 homolog isoform X2 n=1 Tax=Cylas formicarius TaxID=197179 RepID=UPI002958DAB1|nr:male-specific lethal 3 homolog isoform X2 [Cylas formicarius]
MREKITGERVLCYEPDPTKAKVLYDSKVLDVVIRKDQAGKKIVEYLIHFQGWNSSWDRCVGEDHVLKDTPENRQLQKDLAEKAQLQLGAYLYRKERKKRNRKISDRATFSEEGSSDSQARIDGDNCEMTSSSDEHSSIEDEAVEIELTPELREVIEIDYSFIKKKHKLLKLPAEPNIVTILETYYKHYATSQICGLNEKPSSRYKYYSHNQNCRPKHEDVQRNLAICREVMDGLRLYFDFTVNDLLLYGIERGQIQTAMAVSQLVESTEVKMEVKSEINSSSGTRVSSATASSLNGNSGFRMNSRRRTLRSSTSTKVEPHNNGSSVLSEDGTNAAKPSSSAGSTNSDTSGPLARALSWKLLPDYVYNQQPPPPCLVYGATHLLRLFVKLPELLAASSIPENKMKILLRHFDSIIDHLTEHKEWFGEKFYVDLN